MLYSMIILEMYVFGYMYLRNGHWGLYNMAAFFNIVQYCTLGVLWNNAL